MFGRQANGDSFSNIMAPYAIAAVDIVALFLSLFLGQITHAFWYHVSATYTLFDWWGGPLGFINLLIFHLLIVVTLIAFFILGHYARRKAFWDELKEIIQVILFAAVLHFAIVFLGKWQLSRLWIFSTWTLALLLVPLMRVLLKWTLLKTGIWRRSTVIIGTGQNAREAALALMSDPLSGFQLCAFLSPGRRACNSPIDSIPAMPMGDNPIATLSSMNYPHVVVAMDMDQWQLEQPLIQQLSLSYRDLIIAPPMRGLPLFGLETLHFFSHEVLMLRVRNNLARLGPQLLKRMFDVVCSGLLLITLSPLFAFVSLRILIEDGFPVFFTQERMGRYGKSFECYKFRSMVKNADELLEKWKTDHPERWNEYIKNNFKLRDDPRVLKVGKWMRRLSIDEFPQLWNVLKGDMSLVGPRPLLERELPWYGDHIQLYCEIRPGITGLWQISGRSETTFADRASLDAWYIKNWSLWYDIVILLRTVKVVLLRKGAY